MTDAPRLGPASHRRRHEAAAAIGMAGAIWLVAASATAQTCECQAQPPDLALKGATAAFEGRAEAAEESAEGATGAVTFAVVRSWKGVDREQVRVTLPQPGTPCALTIEAGQTYLVYASGASEALALSPCSRTRPIEEAEEDLKTLGAGVVPVDPTPHDERPVLPETMSVPKGQGGCAGCRLGNPGRGRPWLLWSFAAAALVWMRGRRRYRGSQHVERRGDAPGAAPQGS